MSELNLGRVVGSMWYSGNGITGTSTTPTIFLNSGVTEAHTEDMYLNLTDVNRGNVYQCTKGGDDSTAEWVYIGTILGPMPEVINDLTSTSTTKALSAKQGKVLKDLIDAAGLQPLAVTPTSSQVSYTASVVIEDKSTTFTIYDDSGNTGTYTYTEHGGATAAVNISIGTSIGLPNTGAVITKIESSAAHIQSYTLYDDNNSEIMSETPSLWNHVVDDDLNIMPSGNITDGTDTHKLGVISKIINGIRTELYPITHSKAVWFSKEDNKTVHDKLTEMNSGLTASGCYNRGKDLTPYVVDGTLWDRIHGTNGFKKYEDIMPWDYINLDKTITAPSSGGGSATGTSIVRVAQRGGINPYQFGDTPTDCLVMVPDTHFGMSKMNATNDATGGYKSSFMVSTILPNINSQLETTNLAGHIVPTIELITNSINASGWGKLGSASGASNNWEWTDGGSGRLAKQKCVLMSEMEVYGGTVFSSSGYDTGNACMQLEAFRNSKDAAMPYPIYFWLKDVASAAFFCSAYGYNGTAGYNRASYVICVRPRFIIS